MTAPQQDSAAIGWRFDNSYARLPDLLYARLAPRPVAAPRVALLNHGLAAELGLSLRALPPAEAAAVFSGNQVPPGAAPLAQAYAGHQFGGFTMLGDGRAILLGEHLTPQGQRFDIQLKGSGRTPFSRGGDGRAALGPMLREYIISEAMHALGVPTTRSLAVVTTGEVVQRERPLPGAVLTRVARSHVRVGTFQYLARRGARDALALLVQHTLHRHDPGLDGGERPAEVLLTRAVERQAALIAQWMLVGFVHGVMNTDNMALSGETIDYGPCAFLETYDPAAVFSSIDEQGRYAYGNQPRIALWNLTRLAEALLPLLGEAEDQAVARAEAALARFPALYQEAWLAGMRRKLGLFTAEDDDDALAEALLSWLARLELDYTQTLRQLAEGRLAGALLMDEGVGAWQRRWQERLSRQPQPPAEALALMQAANPALIPRNHQVERALAQAVEQGDLGAVERLLSALAAPYAPRPEHDEYRLPAAPDERVLATFCGT